MQAVRLRKPSAGAVTFAAIANTKGGGTMPSQRSVQYTPRTARAIQWLGAFTLFQAIGIAGLTLAG
jgi:hypothetical protein